MRRVLCLLLPLAVTAAAPPAWAGPKIEFDPPQADLGIIEGDAETSFSVFIRNDGDDTLRISRVRVTCGCTVAILPDSTVEPGGRVPLKGIFNSRKFEGEIHKALFVDSNDPKRKRVPLTVEGFIVRGVSYSPRQVFFANARVHEGETKSVTIRSAKEIPLAVTGASMKNEIFRVETFPLARAGDWRIDVTLLPQDKGQSFRDTVTVLTNIEKYAAIRIPVLGQIR
jgi:hypothetical protein